MASHHSNNLHLKYARLLDLLHNYGANGLAVCYSGGVDSTLVVAAAQAAAVTPLLALTFVTPLMAQDDREIARTVAEQLACAQQLIELDTLQLPEVAANSQQRCYYCKQVLYQAALQKARLIGGAAVVDGCNADDLAAFRPGNRAAEELQIRHPLAEAGLTKAEIRLLASELALPNWNRPASPCLASRFPYHTQLTPAALRQVEAAEAYLRQEGFSEFRLRVHGDLVRLELPAADLDRAVRYREIIISRLRALGYRYITLDLEPFASGSFDRAALLEYNG